MNPYLINRRRFLKESTVAAAGVVIAAGLRVPLYALETGGVSIIVDLADTIAVSRSPQWALTQLKGSLEGLGKTVKMINGISQAAVGDLIIVASSGKASLTAQIGAGVPATPEAIALMSGNLSGRQVTLVSGSDARGMVYAILELTDRVLFNDTVAAALSIPTPIVEETRTKTRSICRPFVSEQEDKRWFYDKTFWDEYLTVLASSRVNRFNLTFGHGHDFGGGTQPNTIDGYFVFLFPFFVSIRGVTAAGLPDAERIKNFEMLQYIAEGCGKRGLEFQLGNWCQSKIVETQTYRIQGLSGTNGGIEHAAYSRDALSAILTACPDITGLTFRVHGESGIPEGSFEYWKTVFSAVTPFVNTGRPMEIDMHAKNCSQGYLDAAQSSKANVVISPKKVGEQTGLPYHHMSLRARDIQQNTGDPTALQGKSTRHGYSNFLQEGRTWGVLHRMWPGGTRHLLFADPAFAAGYGRVANFCGSQGIEYYEPLSWKGRRGTGVEGGERNSYKDTTLTPEKDFHKFLYTYRVWGRNVYNPDTNPETWRRYLVKKFGSAAARDVEDALGNSSRIIGLVVTNHAPAVSSFYYYPELLAWPQNIVDGMPIYRFNDGESPLALASSFDPQLFPTIDKYTEALLAGNEYDLDAYFPIEFSQWVEDFANTALEKITSARSKVSNSQNPEFRRIDIDVQIQAGIGLFFGQKWRAAVLYTIYRKTNDANAKTEAIKLYQSAIDNYVKYCVGVGSVYESLGYGPTSGHWRDRVNDMNADLQALKNIIYNTVQTFTTHPGPAPAAITKVLGRSARPLAGSTHTQPAIFSKGSALNLLLNTDGSTTSAKLYYRHVNQSEAWQSIDMIKSGNNFNASIPGAYTNSNFPLQYYFSLKKGTNSVVLYPGLNETLSNQPYYHVRSTVPVVSNLPLNGAEDVSTIFNASVVMHDRHVEIHYTMNSKVPVTVKIYSLSGDLLTVSSNNRPIVGYNTMKINLKDKNLAAGKYVIHITAGRTILSKTISIMK